MTQPAICPRPPMRPSNPNFERAAETGLVDKAAIKQYESIEDPALRDKAFGADSVEVLKGIGKVGARKLKRRGIKTVHNLTFSRAWLEDDFPGHLGRVAASLKSGLLATMPVYGPR